MNKKTWIMSLITIIIGFHVLITNGIPSKKKKDKEAKKFVNAVLRGVEKYAKTKNKRQEYREIEEENAFLSYDYESDGVHSSSTSWTQDLQGTLLFHIAIGFVIKH